MTAGLPAPGYHDFSCVVCNIVEKNRSISCIGRDQTTLSIFTSGRDAKDITLKTSKNKLLEPKVLKPWKRKNSSEEIITHLKFNEFAPEKLAGHPKGKDHLPTLMAFSGELLNFGGCIKILCGC